MSDDDDGKDDDNNENNDNDNNNDNNNDNDDDYNDDNEDQNGYIWLVLHKKYHHLHKPKDYLIRILNDY